VSSKTILGLGILSCEWTAPQKISHIHAKKAERESSSRAEQREEHKKIKKHRARHKKLI
jgi:hypothetical protein